MAKKWSKMAKKTYTSKGKYTGSNIIDRYIEETLLLGQLNYSISFFFDLENFQKFQKIDFSNIALNVLRVGLTNPTTTTNQTLQLIMY